MLLSGGGGVPCESVFAQLDQKKIAQGLARDSARGVTATRASTQKLVTYARAARVATDFQNFGRSISRDTGRVGHPGWMRFEALQALYKIRKNQLGRPRASSKKRAREFRALAPIWGAK